jgi:hypothetical protein
MPFLQISKSMAERRTARRKTRQSIEIGNLTSGYERAQAQASSQFQAEQQGLLQGYQTQLAEYGKQMGVYETAARDFQTKANAYNDLVNQYNTVTPFGGTFVALPVRDRSSTYLSANLARDTSNKSEFDFSGRLGQALSGVSGVDAQQWYVDKVTRVTGFDASSLPSNFALKQVGASPAGYPIFQLAQRGTGDPGAFNESFSAQAPTTPVAPDTSGLGEKYTAALQREQEYFQREIGERRSASANARRRMTDRPLLQRESA